MAQKSYPAELDHLEQMLEFIDEFMVKLGWDRDMLFKIRLAAEEVLVNIIHYAYPEAPGKISIDCSTVKEGSRGVCIEIRDTGIPFNILEKPDPDISLPIEQRQIGGLGIFLTRQIMDDIRYARTKDENILQLVKNQ